MSTAHQRCAVVHNTRPPGVSCSNGMEPETTSHVPPTPVPVKFDARAFLSAAGKNTIVRYRSGETVFYQGDNCSDVFYIQTGCVKLSVRSNVGREAIVATLGPGDFFGEGCLTGQRVRMGTATATAPSVIRLVAKGQMGALLRKQHGMSDRFIAHLLARNVRIEADLVDQLFNSTEKRLARQLLLLARYGNRGKPVRMVAPISHESLAEMIGTTRSRVTLFLNKFKKLGFIEYKSSSPFVVNNSLLSVVLHD
jgi:CRP/FNR family transcriptional regulator, cyclic AMP receptor protein